MVIKFTPYVEEEEPIFMPYVEPITSRQNVILDIMKQGYGNTNQILDFLNYDEQGNKIGDFTLDEVKKLQPKANILPKNVISIAEELTGMKLKNKNVPYYLTPLDQETIQLTEKETAPAGKGIHLGATSANTIIIDPTAEGFQGETLDSKLIKELLHIIMQQNKMDKTISYAENEKITKEAELYYLGGGKGLAPSFKNLQPLQEKTVPKFTAYEEEKPVFTPLEKMEGEQMFTPYFEPYDMTPPQIRDMAKIMGVSAEPELEPQMGWEYVPKKIYSYLLEEPIAETGALVSLGLEKGFRLLGMDKLADTQAQVTERYKAPPVSESVREQTAYNRQEAYKQSPEMGTAFDISESLTRVGALLTQVFALGKVPALKPTTVYKRMGTMATHGFLTTPGDLKDKIEASIFRVGYWSTPFIAQHWGATGLKAIAFDSALNTFITLPHFRESYNRARETGNWTQFISDAVTQTTMNVVMALTTKGYPASHRADYIRIQAKQRGIPYNQLKSVIDSFDKAQWPKTEVEKTALARQEIKMQELLAKDDADVRLETLAKDADKAPINKLIAQNETKPIPGIQDKINKVAMELPTNAQKAKVHILAKYKGLLTAKDKEKAVYKQYINSLVGEDSTTKMNQGQIQMLIENLDRMDIRTAKALARTPMKEINPKLLRLIKGIGEIGYKEKYRNPYEVFSKIGLLREVYLPSRNAEVVLYDDKMQFKKEISELRKLRGHTKESPRRIMDSIENPDEKIDLNPAEKRGREFAKKFWDDWANKLELPPEKRRKNYVTHIFEAAMKKSLDKDNTIDPDIMRAFEFGAIPKTMFNPYLQGRMGMKTGLKRDVWAALEAYEDQALKTFHYEPLLKKMNTYARFLPDLSHKYMSQYSKRMTNRPLDIDKGINNDIIEIMKAIENSAPMQKTALKKLTPWLSTDAQGNMAGRIAYYYTGILYDTALGMRAISAIRNTGQGSLTVAEVGLANYVKGLGMLMTKAGRDTLHKGVVYRSRKFAFLPSHSDYVPEKLRKISQQTLMYMFRTADKFNVSSAFCAGYQEARGLGLPEKVCMERGDEVAERTQYMYTKMASPEFNQAATGKILGVFTSWPRNYIELMKHWIKGDVSEVYKNYYNETGVKVYSEDWMNRHRSAITYAMMAALALYAERKTRFRATQYIGFRTLETIPRFLSGQIAGMRVPLALSQIGVGVIGQNRQMLKQGLKNLNPIDWFIIKKELEDYDSGKKDWLDLLLYRSKPKFRLR